MAISASQVWRICRGLDLKPWQTESWMTSHDPGFWAKAADLRGLYLTAVLFAGLNVHEGLVAGWVTDSTRSDNFVEFIADHNRKAKPFRWTYDGRPLKVA